MSKNDITHSAHTDMPSCTPNRRFRQLTASRSSQCLIRSVSTVTAAATTLSNGSCTARTATSAAAPSAAPGGVSATAVSGASGVAAAAVVRKCLEKRANPAGPASTATSSLTDFSLSYNTKHCSANCVSERHMVKFWT